MFFLNKIKKLKLSSDYWGQKRGFAPLLIIGGACPGCPQSLRLWLGCLSFPIVSELNWSDQGGCFRGIVLRRTFRECREEMSGRENKFPGPIRKAEEQNEHRYRNKRCQP